MEFSLCLAKVTIFFLLSKLNVFFSILLNWFQSIFLLTLTIFSTIFSLISTSFGFCLCINLKSPCLLITLKSFQSIVLVASTWTCSIFWIIFGLIPLINNLFSVLDFNSIFGFSILFKLNSKIFDGIKICSFFIWNVCAGPSFNIIPLYPSKSNPELSIFKDSLNFLPLSTILKEKLSISNSSFSFSTTISSFCTIFCCFFFDINLSWSWFSSKLSHIFFVPFTTNLVDFIILLSSFQFL